MASKGSITISHDDLIRMKMRANLIPNGKTLFTQAQQTTTRLLFNISNLSNAQISGSTTPKISREERNNKDSESLKKNSCNEDGRMSKNAYSS